MLLSKRKSAPQPSNRPSMSASWSCALRCGAVSPQPFCKFGEAPYAKRSSAALRSWLPAPFPTRRWHPANWMGKRRTKKNCRRDSAWIQHMIHCSILSITKTTGKIFLALVIQLGRGDRHLPGNNFKKKPKLQEENLKKPYEIIFKKNKIKISIGFSTFQFLNFLIHYGRSGSQKLESTFFQLI